MRYLAADVYDYLFSVGCAFEGDTFATGAGWLSPPPNCQVFMLPEPDLIDGKHWFDAEVLDDNLKDRWLDFCLSKHLKRHP